MSAVLLIAMLTKEPEMLQPDAFCGQNAKCDCGRSSAPDPDGGLTALPRPLAGFKGALAPAL